MKLGSYTVGIPTNAPSIGKVILLHSPEFETAAETDNHNNNQYEGKQ